MVATSNFEHLAELVSELTADLLSAPVTLYDEGGSVLARAGTASADSIPAATTSDGATRVQVRIDGRWTEAVIDRPAGGEACSPRLAQGLVELIAEQTAIVARLPQQDDLKNAFIHDLLRGRLRDQSETLRDAQILGMDLSRPRTVLLIDAADYILEPRRMGIPGAERRIRRREQLVIASIVSFFGLPNDAICASIGNGEVAVLKAAGTQDLEAWVRDDNGNGRGSPSWANLDALKRAAAALITRLKQETNTAVTGGIGRHHPGIAGLACSYEDARAALALGSRFKGRSLAHCLDGLGVAAFVGVADEQTKVSLATHLLSPLDYDPELLTTLTAFFQHDCCPSSTAQALAVHRNTLAYRLDKVTSLTGLDPRRFEAAVQVRLALMLRELRHEAT